MRSEPRDNPDAVLERATAALRDMQVPAFPPAILVRIAAQLAEAQAQPEPAPAIRRFLRILVPGRIAAGLLLAATLTGVLLWTMTGKGSNAAFAEMLRHVNACQSLSFRVTRSVAVTDQGNQTVTAQAVIDSAGRIRQTLPGSPVETGTVISVWDLQQHKAMMLIPEKKQAVLLDLTNFRPEQVQAGPLDLLQQFRKMDERSAAPAGKRQINGRQATGFRISRGEQLMTVWVDPASHLPVLVEVKARNGADGRSDVVMSDFVWNVPVDEWLMKLSPPEGYDPLPMPIDMALPTELELVAALAEPPRVIKTSPEHGQIDVDPSTSRIRVVFDQPMEPDGHLLRVEGMAAPKIVGEPRWIDDRTFEASCQLEPDREYWLSVNSERSHSFRNKKGEAALPYPVSFRTAAAAQGRPLPVVEANPPHVTEAVPDNGQEDVDPGLGQIRVVFDQPMSHRAGSVVGGGRSFPPIQGKPRWLNDRTLVLDCQLEPDHEYFLSINSDRFTNFRNRRGEAAVPYPITFTTAPAAGAMRVSNPRVVQASPDNGQNVDPNTRELRIVFDQPMQQGGWSIVGSEETVPRLVGQPRWENDRTFVWECQLEPNREYWLSINSETFKNFRSTQDRSVVPYPISFRTSSGSAPGPTTQP